MLKKALELNKYKSRNKYSTDISSNYFGNILTTYEDGYQAIIDSKAFFQNEYSEVSEEVITITDKHKVGKVKCFKMHGEIKKT